MMKSANKLNKAVHTLYHFDIYEASSKLRPVHIRLAILLSLALPPTGLLIFFFASDSLLSDHTYSFTNFASSPRVALEGSQTLLMLMIGMVLFHQLLNAALAPIDLWVRSKHENKPIAWEDCFVFSLASGLIGATGIVLINTPLANWLVELTDHLLTLFNTLEPITTIPFVYLVLLVYVLDDVFFYIGHRLAHNVRVIWKLGHMQHHRPPRLTSATSCADYPLFFLDGGGGSFVSNILGKAVFFKLFSEVNAEQALSAALIIASLRIINHSVSHSYAAYLLFSKNKYLAWLENFFVTGRIHYTHHSKWPEHNVASGCNFAAQFVWLDKLMGTYAKPSHAIPETGLFHETRPPGNPIKVALDQWIKLGRELYFNSPKYWLKILFGDPSYEPPVPALQ